jgi:beta-glucosidase
VQLPEQHLGGRDSLDLLGAQDQLIQSIVETGVPTVVVLINGRPLSINYAAAHVPAIVESWYPGKRAAQPWRASCSATSTLAAN